MGLVVEGEVSKVTCFLCWCQKWEVLFSNWGRLLTHGEYTIHFSYCCYGNKWEQWVLAQPLTCFFPRNGFGMMWGVDERKVVLAFRGIVYSYGRMTFLEGLTVLGIGTWSFWAGRFMAPQVGPFWTSHGLLGHSTFFVSSISEI